MSRPWKTLRGLCLGITFALAAGLAEAAANEPIPLLVDGPLGVPAERALAELETALKGKGFEVTRQASLPQGDATALVVGVAGASKTIDRLVAAGQLDLAKEPESLCVKR